MHAQYNYPRRPVTFIAGIVCRDGVVLAADSQITTGNHKETWGNKINVVKLKDGIALVAEAGLVPLSNRALEIIHEMAKDAVLDKDDSFPILVRDAVWKVRNEQYALYPKQRGATKWMNFFLQPQNYFDLIGGYCWAGKWKVFSVNLAYCQVEVPKGSFFMTRGSGATVGKHLLARFANADMSIDAASVMALHVSEILLRTLATNLGRTDTWLGIFHRRMKARLGPAAANTATARKLATLVYHLLKYKEEYIEVDSAVYEQRFRRFRLNRLRRQAEELGCEIVETKAAA
jgi:20S proteasome alpha/beta subunit